MFHLPASFDWDPHKDEENQRKHGVTFALAHREREQRYFCFADVRGRILTVRFTFRESTIRIIGAGYWRKGKVLYERERRRPLH